MDGILCYEVVWGWGWAKDQWKLCYVEMETEHVIHVINSHSIHMWDILNITVLQVRRGCHTKDGCTIITALGQDLYPT